MKKLLTFLFERRTIKNIEQLEEFLRKHLTHAAGKLIISYSQNRLGKRHYAYVADKNYSKELIIAQIKLHVKICEDMFHLICERSNINSNYEMDEFQKIFLRLHHEYRGTSPIELNSEEKIEEPVFKKTSSSLEDCSSATGKFLYEILPLTENVLIENVRIFQGQIRYTYINILDRLEKMKFRGLSFNLN